MSKIDPDAALQRLLASGEPFATRDLVEATGLTRQALRLHLARWLEEERIERIGRGRATRYRAGRATGFDRAWPTSGPEGDPGQDLDEEQVWAAVAEWLDAVAAPTREARDIARYATTEWVNNAVDHSGAAEVRVRAAVEGGALGLEVADQGIGALERVRARFGLDDSLHALQELSKGKVTTQPERHTGEGLFFSSKTVEHFELDANGLRWIVDNAREDQAVAPARDRPGTRVSMTLDLRTRRPLAHAFERYTTDLVFDRTRAVVRLFEHGTEFVSRSEAKRLAHGLEKFREVEVDFTGVRTVGQGFVDELFRVWAGVHPDTRLVPTSMSETVDFMVRRGLPDARS